MSKLTARNLVKKYKKRTVVNDMSMSIEQGEIVGLLGPNGAGKTTCFYMIVGLINVDSGHIFLDDHDITAMAMHQRARLGVGYLPQEASIFRKLSVFDNIMAVLQLRHDLSLSQRQEKITALLDELHLSHLHNSLGMSLSGGERRRVEIARALAMEPRFMLLDEPFAGIDPISVVDIKQIIRQLRDKGIGILITDHNVRETLDICENAYILNEGQLLALGSPQEILAHTTVRTVYLGSDFVL